MAIDLAQFHEMFVAESDELLTHAEGLLSAAALGETGPDEIAELGRCMHSVKGGSETFGFSDMAALAGVCEELLGHIRDGRVPLDDSIIGVSRSAVLALRRQLSTCHAEAAAAGAVIDSVRSRLYEWCDAAGRTTNPAETAGVPTQGTGLLEVRFLVSRVVCSDILVDDMLEELGQLGELCTIDRPLDGLHAGGWRIELATRHPEAAVRTVLERVAEPGSLRIACSEPRGVLRGAGGDRDGTLRRAGDEWGELTRDEAIGVAAEHIARQCAGLAGHVETQAVAFADMLCVLERVVLAPREARGGHDELMEALRRVDRTVLQGGRLVERLGAIADALQQLLEDWVDDVHAGPGSGNTGELAMTDEQALRSWPGTARISPSNPVRHRLGAPLPKIKRAAAPTSALEDDWEMLG